MLKLSLVAIVRKCNMPSLARGIVSTVETGVRAVNEGSMRRLSISPVAIAQWLLLESAKLARACQSLLQQVRCEQRAKVDSFCSPGKPEPLRIS
jgi:hypothetical protein